MSSFPSSPPAIPWDDLPSPCYVVDERLLKRNLDILDRVRDRTGARVVLALKGFAMFSVFPLARAHLDGVAASSLHEARLGRDCFGGDVHTYAVAYRDDEFADILSISDHITFNSIGQWHRFRGHVDNAAAEVRCGIRINPEYSEVEVDKYNPCLPGSRFGVTQGQLKAVDLEGISGLHFHTLCEQGADVLQRTLDVVRNRFGDLLRDMEWLNLGGGHHVTRDGYDVDLLCAEIERCRREFDVDVILEPGEAVALNAGYLVATVLDVICNEVDIAILDTSATAHMPDVLEMPYRPEILGADASGALPHTYRLGGMTCLAGDVIGDYSFAEPLRPGRRLVFTDMAHYTMVKTTTFNGVGLPAIALWSLEDNGLRVVKTFDDHDYRSRLS